jgi:hypothetical protein
MYKKLNPYRSLSTLLLLLMMLIYHASFSMYYHKSGKLCKVFGCCCIIKYKSSLNKTSFSKASKSSSPKCQKLSRPGKFCRLHSKDSFQLIIPDVNKALFVIPDGFLYTTYIRQASATGYKLHRYNEQYCRAHYMVTYRQLII